MIMNTNENISTSTSIYTGVIRTHTYWMTSKEYRKSANNQSCYMKMNNDNTLTRTHIYFT
jgi:hypothetical protein